MMRGEEGTTSFRERVEMVVTNCTTMPCDNRTALGPKLKKKIQVKPPEPARGTQEAGIDGGGVQRVYRL
jgi:hypothetical protein